MEYFFPTTKKNGICPARPISPPQSTPHIVPLPFFRCRGRAGPTSACFAFTLQINPGARIRLASVPTSSPRLALCDTTRTLECGSSSPATRGSRAAFCCCQGLATSLFGDAVACCRVASHFRSRLLILGLPHWPAHCPGDWSHRFNLSIQLMAMSARLLLLLAVAHGLRPPPTRVAPATLRSALPDLVSLLLAEARRSRVRARRSARSRRRLSP